MIQIDSVNEQLALGKTQREIATMLGVTQAAISWVRKNKLKFAPAISKQKLFVKEIQTLYNSGLSQTQIANKLGSTPGNVSAFMKRHNILVRPKSIRQLRGKNNPSWTTNPTYAASHQRLKNLRGTPTICETCGETDPTKRYEWASINKVYADPFDYKRLCVSCHRKFDRLLTIPIDAILKLRAEGQTQAQIASRFNCTRSTISNRLRAIGKFGRV